MWSESCVKSATNNRLFFIGQNWKRLFTRENVCSVRNISSLFPLRKNYDHLSTHWSIYHAHFFKTGSWRICEGRIHVHLYKALSPTHPPPHFFCKVIHKLTITRNAFFLACKHFCMLSAHFQFGATLHHRRNACHALPPL